MGTLIHKALGYGIEPRKRPGVLRADWQEHTLDTLYEGVDGEVAACLRRVKMDECPMLFTELPSKDPTKARWGGEYPRRFQHVVRIVGHDHPHYKAVIIQMPSMFESWYRFDDCIDYVDAPRQRDGSPKFEVIRELDVPLYPFIGWMKPDTGESVTGMAMLKEIHEPLGHIPLVPEAVRIIAEATGLFQVERPWMFLRPMIATWWA